MPLVANSVFSPCLMAAAATPVGATNIERLFATLEDGGTEYTHPEELPLPGQYQRGRGMTQYFSDMPGLEAALFRREVKTYVDSGAGAGRAAEEIARRLPDLEAIAISRTDFSGSRRLPANMAYVVDDTKAVLRTRQPTPHVIVDLYGAFTYDVHHQLALVSLYLNSLAMGGQGFIRFDGDHVGVVNRFGMMMFLSEWFQGLHHPDIRAFEGPNPSGPTSLVSILALTKNSHESQFPVLTLSGIKQFSDDVVPFVVYREGVT